MNTKLIVGIIGAILTCALIGTAIGLFYRYDEPVPRTPWPLTNIVPGKTPPPVTSWAIRDYASVNSYNIAPFVSAQVNGDFVVLRSADRALLCYSGTSIDGKSLESSDKMALGEDHLLVNTNVYNFDETGFTTTLNISGSFQIENVFVSDGYSYIVDKVGSAGRVWVFDEDLAPAGLAQLVNPDTSFGKVVTADPLQEILFVAGDTKIYQFAYDPLTSFYSALTDHTITDTITSMVFAAPALVSYNNDGFRVYRPIDDNNIYALKIYQPLAGIVAMGVSPHGELVAMAVSNLVYLYYLGPESVRGIKTIGVASVKSIHIGSDAVITMVTASQILVYGPN